MSSSVMFQRGQVWYVDDNYEPIGSIQGKSRPYLVVSNDACNRYSPVIHMAPITSQHKKTSQPTHIQFFNPRKKQNNWILVEQTMPKSVPDIKDVSDYQYTLSSEVMQEVDKALAIQFALKSFGIDISDFETMLDMIVEQKIAKIQDATQSLLDARMSKYVNALMDRVTDAGKIPEPKEYVPGPEVLNQIQTAPTIVVPEIKKPEELTVVVPEPKVVPVVKKPERPSSAIDRFNARWNKSENTEPKKDTTSETVVKITRPEIIRSDSGRVKWNIELKKQFLEDMASYGPKKVSEIWKLDNRSLYAYRSKFTKELIESGVITESHVNALVPKKEKRGPKKFGTIEVSSSSDMLRDYDEMPLSKFMEKYNISTKAQAVEIAAKLRIG